MGIRFAALVICSLQAFVAASSLEHRSDETALLQHISHQRGRSDPVVASNLSIRPFSGLDGVVVIEIKDTKAKCLNGQHPAILVEKSSTQGADGKDNWMLHMKGGGLCSTKSECKEQASTALEVTWKYLVEEDPEATTKWIDTDPFRYHSRFANWNHAYFPYCSMDLWTGTVEKATEDSLGLNFAGHNIFKAGVEYLVEHFSLATAKNVILQGKSAGGLGVYMNANWLQDALPDAKVTALPVAGHWPAAVQYEGPHQNYEQRANLSLENAANLMQIWRSVVPDTCAAALPETPEYCLFASISSKYITVPTFVVQAQTDSSMTTDHCGISKFHKYFAFEPQISFLKQWQENQSEQFELNLKDGDGWFNPACFMHSEFTADLPLIQNKSYVDAFVEWYFESQTVRMQDYGIPMTGVCPDPSETSNMGIVWPSFPD